MMHSNSISIDEVIEQHGGNLSWIEANYPHAPRPLVDLSTGINPYPYPVASDPNWNYTLADDHAMQAAYKAVSGYYGTPHCVLSSGMQPLMVALAALRMKEYGLSNVGILSPTYNEHQTVWQNMGHSCYNFTDIGDSDYDVVIICNPNNPDGHMIESENVLALTKILDNHEGWLIIDESFMDLMPHQSIAGYVKEYPNLVVLRSCGKFFGLAGVRMSAAMTSAPCAEWLRTMTGPWAISTAACHLLPVMLQDKAWIEATRVKLEKEAETWRGLLEQYFPVVGFTDLFTLIETRKADLWFHHLAERGILARRFEYNDRWLRFGLPNAQHLERLTAILANGPKR